MAKTKSRLQFLIGLLALLSLLATGCGSGSSTESESGAEDDSATEGDAAAEGDSADEGDSAAGEMPTIVVTTNILGDVVGELVGDQAEVVTIMPVGADPHDFQASAQEVDQLLQADALIVNGADFEEGLLDVIESARDEGVPTFEAIEPVSTIEYGAGGHEHDDEHGDDEHDHEGDEAHDDEHGDEHDHEGEEAHDDEHGDEHDHDDEKAHDDEHGDEHEHDDQHGDDEHDHAHEGVDPHFFTDPTRMADAVEGIAGFLASEVDGLDAAALDASVDDYVAQLAALDAEVDELVAAIPEERRILVTNHEVFGYFADQYGFEVVGAVIPGGSTADSASAGELAELAETIEAEGVPAVFSDTSASGDLVETLAAEVGDVAVVELYSESLGESGSDGATYLEMVRTNATRISEALA